MRKPKIGRKTWCIAGGDIPFASHGAEPAFTSRDWISILNLSERDARIEINIYYEEQEPVTGYECEIKSQRMRKIRFNDLINPLPVSLEKPFGAVIHSDVEIVVQFSRMDTGHANRSIMGTVAYSQ